MNNSSRSIPIRIHPFFWVLICLIGWVNSGTILGTMLWGVVIFFSVLIHEYGHALTAIAFGQTASIDLVAFGGATSRKGKKLKLWQEFLVVLNGPIAGFLLFIIFYQIREHTDMNAISPVWAFLLEITVNANLFWTILNLLPIHPLDGGRLVGIICEGLWGIKGIKLGLLLSLVCAVLISLFLFSSNDLFLGSIFLMLAFESYRTWQGYQAIREQDRDQDLKNLLHQAENELKMAKIKEAKSDFEKIRENAKAGVIFDSATRYLGEIKHKEGDDRTAYELLFPLKHRLNADGLKLLHLVAYNNEDWKNGVDIGNLSYQAMPSYDTALLNAFCHAQLSEVRPAIGWLNCALKDGLPNLRLILTKSDFDKIRHTPQFQQFVLSIK